MIWLRLSEGEGGIREVGLGLRGILGTIIDDIELLSVVFNTRSGDYRAVPLTGFEYNF